MIKSISDRQDLPYHVGIIVDGNRRWAKENHLLSFAGHKKGAERAEEIVKYAQKLGIKIITIYAFSTENWKRTKGEVSYLMELFETSVRDKVDEMDTLGIQIRILGDFKNLSPSLQKTLRNAEMLTNKNKKMIVNIALNYGGRDELVRTFQKLILSGLQAVEINEEIININLDTAGLPDPDLIIRTSGEQRLSNFLPWQTVYAELYFPKVHWPDFDKNQFDLALAEFKQRQRRLGQ